GGVDVLGRLPPAALLAQPLGDPFVELADRVDADAKLDEVQGHAPVLAEARRAFIPSLAEFTGTKWFAARAQRSPAPPRRRQREIRAALPSRAPRLLRLLRRDHNELCPLGHLIAGADRDFAHRAVERCGEGMLHLHRFDHAEPLAPADAIAFFHVDGEYLAVHRRTHQAAAVEMFEIDGDRLLQHHLRLPALMP